MIFLWSHWFWFLSMKIVENTCLSRTWCFSCNNYVWVVFNSWLCCLEFILFAWQVLSMIYRSVRVCRGKLFRFQICFSKFFFVGYRQQSRYWLLPGGKVVGGVRTPFFFPYRHRNDFFLKGKTVTFFSRQKRLRYSSDLQVTGHHKKTDTTLI